MTRAAADAVLIVDGVFAFCPEINDHWDFRIWLDVDPVISLLRGAERDQNWAGSETEAVHLHRYLPAERLYIEEVNPKRLVDLVIDNAVFGQPRVVRT